MGREPRSGSIHNRFPALAAARAWSEAALARLRVALADLGRDWPEVATVAVSGSLGRLEAGPHSDADVLVILSTAASDDGAAELMQVIWDALARADLPRPKPTGIYATPATVADLCSTATLGQIAEDVPTFGKRLQLLLDARPVYRPDACRDLQAAVLRRYATGFGNWDHLLDDLIRYFRSLRVRDRWYFDSGKGGWYTRSVKSEHSRLLLYAGLLLPLGGAGERLAEYVALTPLERVARVYAEHGDPHFERVAVAYERFLAVLADPEQRARLGAEPPATVADLCRAAPLGYDELLANARGLRRELLRFVLARQADWGADFMARVFF